MCLSSKVSTMPAYSKHVCANRALAIELLCRARLHNQHPHRVIPGNRRLFHHGDSFCISWISSVVGISQACVSHGLLQIPQGNKQTLHHSTMIYHQWRKFWVAFKMYWHECSVHDYGIKFLLFWQSRQSKFGQLGFKSGWRRDGKVVTMTTKCEAKNPVSQENTLQNISVLILFFCFERQAFRVSVQQSLVVLHLQEPPHWLQHSAMMSTCHMFEQSFLRWPPQ